MQTAGNHQVQDEPEIVVEADGDAFADAAQGAHFFAVDRGERRFDGAQQKWAGEAHALERLAQDARFERFDVDGDVGELGHGSR